MADKPRILVCSDWYPPAYKAGGPIRSVYNASQVLAKYASVYVVCGARDLGEVNAMEGISVDSWQEVENVKVFYASTGGSAFQAMKSLHEKEALHGIYLNSLFSWSFALRPLLHFINKCRVVWAPRGMMKPSALAFKAAKKKLFLWVLKRLPAIRKVHWQASSEDEAADIKRIFQKAQVHVVGNVVVPPAFDLSTEVIKRRWKGKRTLLYIGRLSPEKNLKFLLELLGRFPNSLLKNLKLSVIGPTVDYDYTELCKKLAAELPLKVDFKGEIPPHELPEHYRSAYLFCFPTLGENFGHVIYESLSHATPVIISNETPWKKLQEKRAGWEGPLNQHMDKALANALNWSYDEYADYCRGARSVAEDYANDERNINGLYHIFALDYDKS